MVGHVERQVALACRLENRPMRSFPQSRKAFFREALSEMDDAWPADISDGELDMVADAAAGGDWA